MRTLISPNFCRPERPLSGKADIGACIGRQDCRANSIRSKANFHSSPAIPVYRRRYPVRRSLPYSDSGFELRINCLASLSRANAGAEKRPQNSRSHRTREQIANVCFSQKRSFKPRLFHDFERLLSAKSGRSKWRKWTKMMGS